MGWPPVAKFMLNRHHMIRTFPVSGLRHFSGFPTRASGNRSCRKARPSIADVAFVHIRPATSGAVPARVAKSSFDQVRGQFAFPNR